MPKLHGRCACIFARSFLAFSLLTCPAICHAGVVCPTPIAITSITPSPWQAGETINVTISGTNISCGGTFLTVQAAQGTMTVSNVVLVSTSEITATVSISADAPTEQACLSLQLGQDGPNQPADGDAEMDEADDAAASSTCTSTYQYGAAMAVQIIGDQNKACSVQPATSFMQDNTADASSLASELGVPTYYVLAMAGDESQYGTSNIAVGAHNYFGLHAGAPGSIGPWPQNPIVAAFPSEDGFMASGQSFVQLASPLLKGLGSPIDPKSFFTAMHKKWGIGTPNYIRKMVQSAKMAQIRMNCP